MIDRSRIKLVSLNIELNKHLDSVCAFLRAERPDTACFQEVVESDMLRLSEALGGMEGRFEPMAVSCLPHHLALGMGGSPFGLALFSRFPVKFAAHYYVGVQGEVPRFKNPAEEINRMLLAASFAVNGKPMVFGVTHFTWTFDGEADDVQRQDMRKLLELLAGFPEIVFCGDFNAPRGREIWGKIAEQYKDNIPPEYQSSVDPVLHRLKGLQRMVDGLFSTSAYRVSGVRLVEGISDHKAVVGFVERVAK